METNDQQWDVAAQSIKVSAEVSSACREIEWMGSLLKTGDARERLDRGLLDRLFDALAGRGSEECFELTSAATACAGSVTIKVQLGGVFKELAAALRALGFQFHDTPNSGSFDADLMRLVLSWEQSARSQFQCAKRTADPMGRRLVEHGAMCYFNCASELKRALSAGLPPPLPNQAEQ